MVLFRHDDDWIIGDEVTAVERVEQVILTNLCMIQNGTKVLVEEKVGKGADGIIFPGGHVEEHEPISSPEN